MRQSQVIVAQWVVNHLALLRRQPFHRPQCGARRDDDGDKAPKKLHASQSNRADDRGGDGSDQRRPQPRSCNDARSRRVELGARRCARETTMDHHRFDRAAASRQTREGEIDPREKSFLPVGKNFFRKGDWTCQETL